MSMTTVAKSTFLNGLVGKTSTGLVLSNCYIGLSSTAPNADGSGFTEPTAAEYARGIVGMESQSGTQVMGAPSAGSITNNKILYFPEALSDWGTLTHFGLFTSASGGVPVIYGTLSASVHVTADHVPLFRVNSLTLSVA